MRRLTVAHHRGGASAFPATKPRYLRAAPERRFLASLVNGGDGTVVVQRDDPEHDQIAPDDVLQFVLDGVPVFAVLVDEIDSVREDPQGLDAARQTTFDAPSHLAVLRRGLVSPLIDADRDPISDTVYFDYSHPEYDDSLWGFANVLTDVASMQVDTGGGWGPWAGWAQWSPDHGDQMGFRPTDAGILGPSDGTILGTGMAASSHYFRDTFSTGIYDGNVLLFFAVDNTGVVSIDGKRVLSAGTEGDKETSGFLQTHTVVVSMSAGTHTIAVECTNFPPVTANNPTGFSASAWIPGYGPINPPRLLWSSSGGMKMLDYQDEAPGMTFGTAFRLALEVEQAAGRLSYLTLGFDDDLDTDGNAWPVVNIAAQTNQTLYDVLVEAMAVHIDAEMDPASWTLNAWVKDMKGGASGVTAERGRNITALSHKRAAARATVLTARWKGGHRTYGSGDVHAAVDLGVPDTAQEVDRILAQLVAINGNPREQITIALDPDDDTEFPWKNTAFVLGSTISVPDHTDTPTTERVLELGLSETDTADRPIVQITARDVIAEEQDRIIEVITR